MSPGSQSFRPEISSRLLWRLKRMPHLNPGGAAGELGFQPVHWPICDHSSWHNRRQVGASMALCASCNDATTLYYSLLNCQRAGITCILFIALSLSSSVCLVHGNKNIFVLKKYTEQNTRHALLKTVRINKNKVWEMVLVWRSLRRHNN